MRVSTLFLVGCVILLFCVQEGACLSLGSMLLAVITGYILGKLTLGAFIVLLMAVTPPPANVNGRRFTRSVSSQTIEPVAIPLEITNKSIHQTTENQTQNYIQSLSNRQQETRFLQNVFASHAKNCLPMLMCTASASSSPFTRNEFLSDYQFIMNEILKSDSDGKNNNEKKKTGEKNQYDELLQALSLKDDDGKVDDDYNNDSADQHDANDDSEETDKSEQNNSESEEELDKVMELLSVKEQMEIEDKMYEELADEDPEDLEFIMADMKMNDKLKKIQRRPYRKPIAVEETIQDMIPDPEIKQMFEGYSESLYRNLDIFKKNITADTITDFRGKIRRFKKLAFFSRKQRELGKSNDVDEKLRIAAEVGRTLKSSRQCRNLFQSCPYQPSVLTNMVNNLRRVFTGTPVQSNGNVGKVNSVPNFFPPVQTLPSVNVVVNLGPEYGKTKENTSPTPTTVAPSPKNKLDSPTAQSLLTKSTPSTEKYLTKATPSAVINISDRPDKEQPKVPMTIDDWIQSFGIFATTTPTAIPVQDELPDHYIHTLKSQNKNKPNKQFNSFIKSAIQAIPVFKDETTSVEATDTLITKISSITELPSLFQDAVTEIEESEENYINTQQQPDEKMSENDNFLLTTPQYIEDIDVSKELENTPIIAMNPPTHKDSEYRHISENITSEKEQNVTQVTQISPSVTSDPFMSAQKYLAQLEATITMKEKFKGQNNTKRRTPEEARSEQNLPPKEELNEFLKLLKSEVDENGKPNPIFPQKTTTTTTEKYNKSKRQKQRQSSEESSEENEYPDTDYPYLPPRSIPRTTLRTPYKSRPLIAVPYARSDYHGPPESTLASGIFSYFFGGKEVKANYPAPSIKFTNNYPLPLPHYSHLYSAPHNPNFPHDSTQYKNSKSKPRSKPTKATTTTTSRPKHKKYYNLSHRYKYH